MNSDPGRGADEATWRNRFIVLNLVRIGGTILALFGILIWHSDWIRQGGALIGLPLALLGVAISFGGPKWLARKWQASGRR